MSDCSIYLAGPFHERVPLLQGWRADLLRRGYTVTSRWIDERDEDADEAATSAVRDVQDLEMADCLILHNGVARRDTRGGNHFEMGAAWALGKRVIVVGVVGNVFHMLPEVEIFSTWPECLEGL